MNRKVKIVDIIATYEEVFNIPEKEKITHYFGDYAMYSLNIGVTEKEVHDCYQTALNAIGLSDKEFQNNKDYSYRNNILGDMLLNVGTEKINLFMQKKDEATSRYYENVKERIEKTKKEILKKNPPISERFKEAERRALEKSHQSDTQNKSKGELQK